jgi:BMFP domain-containing protein YqiC
MPRNKWLIILTKRWLGDHGFNASALEWGEPNASRTKTVRKGFHGSVYGAQAPGTRRKSQRGTLETHRNRRSSMKPNEKLFDELGARVRAMLDDSPARDIEKNVKAMLMSGFARLDLITREEFDVQSEVLKRTREKLTQLEARVAALEQRLQPEGGTVPSAAVPPQESTTEGT